LMIVDNINDTIDIGRLPTNDVESPQVKVLNSHEEVL